MVKPKLQIACDHLDLPSALKDIKKIGDIVDIIEVGTILMLQTGAEAIRCLRAMYPHKKIVADTKCADAGNVVARNCKIAGADIMTAICAATIPTLKAAAKEIDEIQIELYGDWQAEQEDKWLEVGINHVIYHQSRDVLSSTKTWGKSDLYKVRRLVDKGFRVSVTGGVNREILSLFEEIDVDTFIIGRSITSTDDSVLAAKQFQNEIKKLWGES